MAVPTTNQSALSADIRQAISAYRSTLLTRKQMAVWGPRMRELVTMVPPVDRGDAQRMLTAVARMLTDLNPPLTVAVDDMLTDHHIRCWSHDALRFGMCRESVRLYASWLHRLRRVRIGCSGRRARATPRLRSRPEFSPHQVEQLLADLPAGLAVLYVGAVGAGVSPAEFTGGHLMVDATGVMCAVTTTGSSTPVTETVADLAGSLVGVTATGLWADLRGVAGECGVDLSWRAVRNDFVAAVVRDEDPQTVFGGRGLSRCSVDRAISELDVVEDSEMWRWLRTPGVDTRHDTIDGSLQQIGAM